MKIKQTCSLITDTAILLLALAQLSAAGVSWGPVQAVANKVDEYNDKMKQEGIRRGEWQGGKGMICGTITDETGQPAQVTVWLNDTPAAYSSQNGYYSITGVEEDVEYKLQTIEYYGNSTAQSSCVIRVKGTVRKDLVVASTIVSSNFGNVSSSWGPWCYKLTAANSPYTVNEDINFDKRLVIEPGVVIKFSGSYSFSAWRGIKAAGTAAAPIVFTSGRSSKAPGDYGSISLGSSSCDTRVQLDYVTFEYGSSIWLSGSSTSTVTNCRFKDTNNYDPILSLQGNVSHCDFAGLSIYGSPTITYCNISDQVSTWNEAGRYKINNCNLTKGSSTVVQNSANWPLDLTQNWWGTSDPSIISTYISSTVGSITYSPFLGSAVTTAGPQ